MHIEFLISLINPTIAFSNLKVWYPGHFDLQPFLLEFQTMITIKESHLGLGDIVHLICVLAPGHSRQPVEIVARHTELAAVFLKMLQLILKQGESVCNFASVSANLINGKDHSVLKGIHMDQHNLRVKSVQGSKWVLGKVSP